MSQIAECTRQATNKSSPPRLILNEFISKTVILENYKRTNKHSISHSLGEWDNFISRLIKPVKIDAKILHDQSKQSSNILICPLERGKHKAWRICENAGQTVSPVITSSHFFYLWESASTHF